MRYNKWKDECLFWKGVFAEKFMVNNRETNLSAYIQTFVRRKHKDPKLTKLRSQFRKYLDRVAGDMCQKYHNVQYNAYGYLYKPTYTSAENRKYNPYIGITKEDCVNLRMVTQLIRARHRATFTAEYITEVLDAIEKASNTFDTIRTAIYNINHPKKRRPIIAVKDNYLVSEGLIKDIDTISRNAQDYLTR